jgi:hypothetical protein
MVSGLIDKVNSLKGLLRKPQEAVRRNKGAA